jgi:hypothetical protein
MLDEEYVHTPEAHVNFHSHDWLVLRTFILAKVESCVAKLCSDLSQDETSKVRGELVAYREMLNLETAALRAAQL